MYSLFEMLLMRKAAWTVQGNSVPSLQLLVKQTISKLKVIETNKDKVALLIGIMEYKMREELSKQSQQSQL